MPLFVRELSLLVFATFEPWTVEDPSGSLGSNMQQKKYERSRYSLSEESWIASNTIILPDDSDRTVLKSCIDAYRSIVSSGAVWIAVICPHSTITNIA